MNIYGNGATIDGNEKARIFQINGGNVVFYNITFVNGNSNNEYGGGGGAINGNCKAMNCTFSGNAAAERGGAMCGGSAIGCSFVGNFAVPDGGAMYWGSAVNCTFSGNDAERGGAMYGGSAIGCSFVGNSAGSYGGAMYWGSADTCIFKTDSDTCFNTNIFPPTLSVDNFTSVFNSGKNITFDLKTNGGMEVSNGNISISLYYKNNDSWFGNCSCLSGEGWVVDLPAGYYYAIYNTEYENFEKINRTITINKANSSLNISDVTLDYGTSTYVTVTTGGATGITAKINDMDAIVKNNTIIIPILYLGTYTLTVTTIADGNHNNITKNVLITVNKIKTELSADAINTSYNSNDDLVITLKDSKGTPLSNQLLFVDLNGVKMFMTDSNGQVKVLTHGLPANTYAARILFTGDDNYKKSNAEAKVTVNKDSTSLSADAITTTYNINKDLVVTLKDSNGKAINSVKVTVVLNGKTYTPTTDANGQVKLSTYGLTPKSYVATITFNGNNNYANSTTTVKVTVTKATPKLTAKAKTFKKSIKTKKYAVTLNDNNGKAMKKVKLTLKVKGKTYKARTNAKGKATFKIKKLTKKGKYEATIKYNGNKYYNKVTKKVKIVIK